MKALCWHGKHDIRYQTVPDPTIEPRRDAIDAVGMEAYWPRSLDSMLDTRSFARCRA